MTFEAACQTDGRSFLCMKNDFHFLADSLQTICHHIKWHFCRSAHHRFHRRCQKGLGCFPNEHAERLSGHRHCSHSYSALNFDLVLSSLINSIQKQENSALGRLKSSQELDKTDEISMALWYSVLQVVLYPLLGLIMRGICYGSFLQEVVQIID